MKNLLHLLPNYWLIALTFKLYALYFQFVLSLL